MNFPDIIRLIFTPGNFEPHRYHFDNHPELMWFIVIGNGLVALAYFLIPLALVLFIRKRKDLVFHWVFIFFAAFIFFCALTHLVHIIIFWYPVYWLQAIIDSVTGVISIATALALIPVIPQALKLPSPEQLRRVNTSLQDEIIKKENAEKEIKRLNRNLEKRVKDRTRDLEEAYSQLQETEKRKDDFISMASHELKTPITSMNGYIYALQKRLLMQNDETTENLLKKIQNQVNKQTKLVTDLLDVTRLQGHKLKSVKALFNLNTLVKDIASDMQATTEKQTLIVEGNIRRLVIGDRERIGQVLNNILSNAIKFSPHSEKITISLHEEKDNAIVSVQDYGMGIDKKHLAKIFNRFYRVYDDDEKTFPGLGVGLYISSKIIEQNGGKMWVESEKGEGSIFSFSLRLAKADI